MYTVIVLHKERDGEWNIISQSSTFEETEKDITFTGFTRDDVFHAGDSYEIKVLEDDIKVKRDLSFIFNADFNNCFKGRLYIYKIDPVNKVEWLLLEDSCKMGYPHCITISKYKTLYEW